MEDEIKVSTLVGLGRELNRGNISKDEYEYLFSLMAGIAAPTSFSIYDHFIVQHRLGERYNTLSRGSQMKVLEHFNQTTRSRC